VCDKSKIGGAHCVSVHHGEQNPPGKVYHNSNQCEDNCNPVV
jgi:hypothetical protein